MGKSGEKKLSKRPLTVIIVILLFVGPMLFGLVAVAPATTSARSDGIDYIIIRDKPGGLGKPAGNITYGHVPEWNSSAKPDWYYYAAGYNKTSGYVNDVNVGWSLTSGNAGSLWTYSNYTIFRPIGIGSTMIVCTYSPANGPAILSYSGIITVIDNKIDSIVIRKAGYSTWIGDQNYYAGITRSLYAAGYNDTYGYEGNFAVNWSSSNSVVGTILNSFYIDGNRFNGYPAMAQLRVLNVGTCKITAEFRGLTNSSGTITVSPGIDSIIIRDAPGGSGKPVGNMTYDVGEVDTFYAAGYNKTKGYQSDIQVNWRISYDIGSLEGGGSFITFKPWLPGTAVISCEIITLWAKVTNSTGILNVNNTVDYIILRDMEEGKGNPVDNRTFKYNSKNLTGPLPGFWAAGYNNSKGYLTDVPVEWTLTNKYIGNLNSYSTGTSIYPAYSGSTAVVARYRPSGNPVIETISGIQTIIFHKIDRIVIHAKGSNSWVESRYYYSGLIDYYYAAGYNNTYGLQGDFAANWSSSNPSVCSIKPSGYNSNEIWGGYPVKAGLIALEEGTCTITAEFMGITNTTGTIKVGPGIDYLIIRDGPQNTGRPVVDRIYNASDTDTFYAAAYNTTKGYQDDIYVSWMMNDRVGSVTGKGNSTTFAATGAGSDILRCYLNYWPKELSASSGIITVFKNKIDRIAVNNFPKNYGSWVDNRTYFIGDRDMFFAAGYNDTYGYEGDFAVKWTSSDPSVCSIIRSDAYITRAELKALSLGNITITATLVGGLTNTSGTITVKQGLDYIIIRDKPNGGGKWVGAKTFETIETGTFYAAGYNNSAGFIDDVKAFWSAPSNEVGLLYPLDGSRIEFTSSVKFVPLFAGTTYVEAYYYYNRYHPEYDYAYNKTGELKVNKPPDITVDDDKKADYSSIQDAINGAYPGSHIYVKEGQYNEHIIINKTVRITGDNKYDEVKSSNNTRYFLRKGLNETIINGNETGIVLYITASFVHLKGLTVQNGKYGIFLQKTKYTRITDCIIKNYDTGIYNNQTNDSYIAYNDIKNGKRGILTSFANNDAVRYNRFINNSEYGAKDFNSDLINCFNWNYFYNNKIGYWYDPTVVLTELEFDGNILEHNEIGVKVSDASTVRLTNNKIYNSQYGILIENASPRVSNNRLEDNTIGIYMKFSSSLIQENNIKNSTIGIYLNRSSPIITENNIKNSLEHSIFIEDSKGVSIKKNEIDDIVINNSTIDDMNLTDAVITVINSTISDITIDEYPVLTKKWLLKIKVEDRNGSAVNGATVEILDRFGKKVSVMRSGSDGWTDDVVLIEFVFDVNGITYHTPHLIHAKKDNAEGSVQIKMDKNRSLTIVISEPAKPVLENPTFAEEGSEYPWFLILAFGSIIALGIGGLLSTEIAKVALLSLLIPLYMKLKKEDVLEHYDRGRVYQFIELNPGEHYNSIKKALNLNNGSLSYHLYVLEKAEKLVSRKDGIYKRFYPTGSEIPENNGSELTEVQKRIVESIKDLPGANQKELASVLGLRQSTLSYQLTNLDSRGVITTTKNGKHVNYYFKQ